MAIKFGTLDFYQAMADELNADAEWLKKGKNVTNSMVFSYLPPLDKSFYMDFQSGKVVNVREAAAEDKDGADFVLTGSGATWHGIFGRKIDPTVALTTGKLHVKGKMTQLFKNMSAFKHVLVVMTRVEYEL